MMTPRNKNTAVNMKFEKEDFESANKAQAIMDEITRRQNERDTPKKVTFFHMIDSLLKELNVGDLFSHINITSPGSMHSYMDIILNNENAINSLKQYRNRRGKRKRRESSNSGYWNYDTASDYVLNVNDTIEIIKMKAHYMSRTISEDSEQEALEEFLNAADPQSSFLNLSVDVNHNIDIPFVSTLFGRNKTVVKNDNLKVSDAVDEKKWYETLGYSSEESYSDEMKHNNKNIFQKIFGSLFSKEIWNRASIILDKIGEYGLTVGYLTAFIYILKIDTKKDNKSFFIFVKILGLLTIAKLSYNLITGLDKYSNLELWTRALTCLTDLFRFENTSEVAVPQSFSDDMIEPLSDVILLICNGLIGYKTKNPFSTTILNFAKTTEVQRGNMVGFMAKISDLLAKLLKRMSAPENITTYFEVDVVDPYKVKPVLEIIRSYIADANAGVDVLDPFRSDKIVEINCKANAVLKELDTRSYDYRCLSQGITELSKKSLDFETAKKALRGDRVEPVGVLLMGKPSVKKTILLARLAKIFTYATIDEREQKSFEEAPESYIFCKPVDKFWDTFTQKVRTVIADDAFQKRAAVGSESSEGLDTIKMINSAALPLAMADVAAKNNAYARPGGYFANTNRDTTNIMDQPDIFDPKAVVRRFAIIIDVSVNSKYKTDINDERDMLPSTLINDFNGLGDSIEGTTIPDDYWILTPYTFNPHALDNNTLWIPEKPITYDELVFRTIARYKENVKRYYLNKYESLRSFARVKPLIKEKLGDLHFKASWYSPNDPADVKMKEKLGSIMRSVSQKYSECDLEMVAMPQSIDILNDLESETLERRNDVIPHHPRFLDSSEEWFETDSSGCVKQDLQARMQHFVDENGLDRELVFELSSDDFELIYSNCEVKDGFVEECKTYTRIISASAEPVYGLGIIQPLVSCLPEHISRENFDKSDFLVGASIHMKLLRDRHPVKSSWFVDESDNDKLNIMLNCAKWVKSVKVWDSILDISRNAKLNETLGKFYESWITICGQIERRDLLLAPVENFIVLINSLDDIERKAVLINLHEFNVFMAVVRRVMLTRIDEGKHPCTGDYEFPTLNDPISVSNVMWNTIKVSFNKVKIWIKENYVWLIGVLALGSGIITGAYYLMRSIYNFFFPDVGLSEPLYSPQSFDMHRMIKHSGKKLHNPRVNHNYFSLAKEVSKLPANSQGIFNGQLATKLAPKFDFSDLGAETGLTNCIAKVLNKYFFVIYLNLKKDNGIEVSRFAQCSNLISRYFVIRIHYAFSLKEITESVKYQGGTLTFRNSLGNINYTMTIEDFLNNFMTTPFCADNDIGLLYINGAQVGSTGIYKFLAREQDLATLSNLTAIDVSIVSTSLKGKPTELNAIVVRDKHSQAKPSGFVAIKKLWEKPTGNPELDWFRLPRSWTYDVGHSPGDCGALIFCKTGNFQNRVIVGMHAAADDNRGIGNMFSQEMADELLSGFSDPLSPYFLKHEEDPVESNYVYDNEELGANVHGGLISNQTFNDQWRWNGPAHSRIRKADIYGKLPEPYDEVLKKPAKMRPFESDDGGIIRPMENALSGYGVAERPCIDQDVVKAAANDYLECVLEATNKYKYPRTLWTLDQALHGHNTVKGMSASTSAGFPLNVPGQENIKEIYFKAREECDISTEKEYYRLIEDIVGELLFQYSEQKTRPFFCFIDFLKDELRKLSKVYTGMTRLISGAPFFMVILFRMAFGAFMDAYAEANMDVGSAIGINCYSTDWDMIARRLTKFGKVDGKHQCIAGDFAGYDKDATSETMNEILYVIEGWYKIQPGYNIEDAALRFYLWAEVTNSRHHFDNELIEWEVSMPSGNPLTALINTINNNILIRIDWIHAGHDIALFRIKVYFIALGDDHALTVHRDFIGSFNEFTLVSLKALTGYTYTNETKEVSVTASRDITEIEFLKRKWKYLPRYDRFVAPLNKESIAGMLNFTKKGAKSRQITMDNIATALRELSLHGREDYDMWYNHLMLLARDNFPGMSFSAVVHHDFDLALKATLNHDFSW